MWGPPYNSPLGRLWQIGTEGTLQPSQKIDTSRDAKEIAKSYNVPKLPRGPKRKSKKKGK